MKGHHRVAPLPRWMAMAFPVVGNEPLSVPPFYVPLFNGKVLLWREPRMDETSVG